MSAMTWTETRRRQDVLREVRAMAGIRRDGELPWSDDYSDVFADREELLAELEYRWRLHVEAQIDSNLAEPALDERRAALQVWHQPVLDILEAHRDRELTAA
jgi:hypothetical protein